MTISNRMKRYMLTMLILLCSYCMVGWANTWEDIQKESAKIQSISARFSQEKHMRILSKPLVSKGHFYFQAPGSVRWEYLSPVKSVLLMHKGNIKRYTLSSKGMVEDSGRSVESMQIVLLEISQWSKGEFTKNEQFSAMLKNQQIILTPKDKGLSSMISRIVINLSDKAGVMKSIKIVEGEGNYTLFKFTDVMINEPIREVLFREVE